MEKSPSSTGGARVFALTTGTNTAVLGAPVKRKLAHAFQSLDTVTDATPGSPSKEPAAHATHSPLLSTTEDLLSSPSFHARLATFGLATYANKPPQPDAVAASRCGWTNNGWDRLKCGLCKVSWRVVVGWDDMEKHERNALEEKQRAALVEAHKDDCPWKVRQCDASIYHVPLQAPEAMICEVETSAARLDPYMQQVEVKHPLTANQFGSLLSTISPGLSETAVLTALFGWAPALTTLSSHNAQSFPASLVRERESTARSLVECSLCHRRVGLWVFAPTPSLRVGPGRQLTTEERHFDLLKEHRSFCPYRVQSTIIPSFSESTVEESSRSAAWSDTTNSVGGNVLVEGWQAVLEVLQYGLGEKQRKREAVVQKQLSQPPGAVGGGGMEVDDYGESRESDNANADLGNEELPQKCVHAPCTPAFGEFTDNFEPMELGDVPIGLEGRAITVIPPLAPLSDIQQPTTSLRTLKSLSLFPPTESHCSPRMVNPTVVPQLILEPTAKVDTEMVVEHLGGQDLQGAVGQCCKEVGKFFEVPAADMAARLCSPLDTATGNLLSPTVSDPISTALFPRSDEGSPSPPPDLDAASPVTQNNRSPRPPQEVLPESQTRAHDDPRRRSPPADPSLPVFGSNLKKPRTDRGPPNKPQNRRCARCLAAKCVKMNICRGRRRRANCACTGPEHDAVVSPGKHMRTTDRQERRCARCVAAKCTKVNECKGRGRLTDCTCVDPEHDATVSRIEHIRTNRTHSDYPPADPSPPLFGKNPKPQTDAGPSNDPQRRCARCVAARCIKADGCKGRARRADCTCVGPEHDALGEQIRTTSRKERRCARCVVAQCTLMDTCLGRGGRKYCGCMDTAHDAAVGKMCPKRENRLTARAEVSVVDQ
ncbi:Zf-C3HC-domain-containing protein [Mycena sanguinolenta]|uniref:Zf-C3HC-domain-containing protein n=1 Tax=Mycena sanguinolenta TaxID=230812 RepID=A0A8H6YAC5_9AGAR|nr:Zf-C3HC-domain-containing protein [Mycena sanguinolenta]